MPKNRHSTPRPGRAVARDTHATKSQADQQAYSEFVRRAVPSGSTTDSGQPQQEPLATNASPEGAEIPVTGAPTRPRHEPPAGGESQSQKISKWFLTYLLPLATLAGGAIYFYGRLDGQVQTFDGRIHGVRTELHRLDDSTQTNMRDLNQETKEIGKQLAGLVQTVASLEGGTDGLRAGIQELQRDLRDADTKNETERRALFDRISAEIADLKDLIAQRASSASDSSD